jgi:proteasome accessory factor B
MPTRRPTPETRVRRDPDARSPYAPAQRLYKVRALLNTATGASIYELAERLEVSVRTALRYLEALRAAGEPIYEERDGKRKVWRLMPTARHQTITLTTSQMLSLFLSRRVFDFLAGTGFKEDLDDIFDKLEATLKRRDFVAARNLDRKIYDVNEAPHRYAGRIEHVNEILTALLHEERLSVTHESVSRGDKTFLLAPYTLVVYKKGLYLAGWSEAHGGIRTFALDAFRDVEWRRGDGFDYPADWDPARKFEGAFGIIGGEAVQVRIRFTERVARYLERRTWHPTQRLRKTKGGVEMTMEVNGTTELRSWILGFGDQAEVLEPAGLREELRAELARAVARYGGAPDDGA